MSQTHYPIGWTRYAVQQMGRGAVRGPMDRASPCNPDSEIVMVDGTFWDASFEQDRSWDDFGTTISGI